MSADIEPRRASLGWHNTHAYACVGGAEMDRPDGTIRRYGVYGTRGDELFVQYEDTWLVGGILQGKPLVRSDCDTDPYLWAPRSQFDHVGVGEVDDDAEATRMIARAAHNKWPAAALADALRISGDRAQEILTAAATTGALADDCEKGAP